MRRLLPLLALAAFVAGCGSDSAAPAGGTEAVKQPGEEQGRPGGIPVDVGAPPANK